MYRQAVENRLIEIVVEQGTLPKMRDWVISAA
jgi:hypothetical protein